MPVPEIVKQRLNVLNQLSMKSEKEEGNWRRRRFRIGGGFLVVTVAGLGIALVQEVPRAALTGLLLGALATITALMVHRRLRVRHAFKETEAAELARLGFSREDAEKQRRLEAILLEAGTAASSHAGRAAAVLYRQAADLQQAVATSMESPACEQLLLQAAALYLRSGEPAKAISAAENVTDNDDQVQVIVTRARVMARCFELQAAPPRDALSPELPQLFKRLDLYERLAVTGRLPRRTKPEHDVEKTSHELYPALLSA